MTVSIKMMLAALLFTAPVAAQDDALQESAVRVFLDCQGGCDFDYLRREITFVSYVRDRTDAHVHLLITSQGTGSGGRRQTLNFIGLRDFAGRADTLYVTTPQTASEDDRRRALASTIKMGLMRFVAASPLAPGIRITYEAPDESPGITGGAIRDPWNYWVFRINANGNGGGEKSRRSYSMNTTVTANRTTEAWKFNARVNGRYSESRSTLSDGRVFINDQRDYNGNTQLVKSVAEHWSVGVSGNFNSSIFSNEKLAVRLAPAIEYSFYPYEESTRRQLRAVYTVGLRRVNYHEQTIYLKTQETLSNENLSISYGVRQPWGDGGVSITGSHYFHDASFYRIQVDGDINVRLFRGFSLNFGGDFSRIHDQLSLRAEDATDEELLVQRQQLQTNYRYGFNLGMSYQFGSIFNNVVNPRMGG